MNIFLDRSLSRFVDFGPGRQEYLDPVILIWIMRSADDDAGIVIEGLGEVSNTRRRDYPGRPANRIFRRRTGNEGRLDRFARFAGIAS